MLTVKDRVYFLKTCLCSPVSYGAGNSQLLKSEITRIDCGREEECLLAPYLERYCCDEMQV